MVSELIGDSETISDPLFRDLLENLSPESTGNTVEPMYIPDDVATDASTYNGILPELPQTSSTPSFLQDPCPNLPPPSANGFDGTAVPEMEHKYIADQPDGLIHQPSPSSHPPTNPSSLGPSPSLIPLEPFSPMGQISSPTQEAQPAATAVYGPEEAKPLMADEHVTTDHLTEEAQPAATAVYGPEAKPLTADDHVTTDQLTEEAQPAADHPIEDVREPEITSSTGEALAQSDEQTHADGLSDVAVLCDKLKQLQYVLTPPYKAKAHSLFGLDRTNDDMPRYVTINKDGDKVIIKRLWKQCDMDIDENITKIIGIVDQLKKMQTRPGSHAQSHPHGVSAASSHRPTAVSAALSCPPGDSAPSSPHGCAITSSSCCLCCTIMPPWGLCTIISS